MKSRPLGWLVMVERVYLARFGNRVKTYSAGRFDTEEQAQLHSATYAVGPEHTENYPMHDAYIARIWVEKETA